MNIRINYKKLKEDELIKMLINAHEYLKATDYYYIRKIERGVDVPDNVVKRRREAIELIQENEELFKRIKIVADELQKIVELENGDEDTKLSEQ